MPADLPPELDSIVIARNKSGGCRIVLPDGVAELLAARDHPTNPYRLFRPTGWNEILAPDSFELCGVSWARDSVGVWKDDLGNRADRFLAAALDRLESTLRVEVLSSR
jgi:hypothetical protein